MTKNPKINYTEYEMEDGEIVLMSTAPVLLLKLKGKNKDAYRRLSKLMMKGPEEEDVEGVYELLYNTYLCANQDEESPMSYREFIENVNSNFSYNVEKVGDMIKPEKKQPSEQPSEEQ